MHEENSAIKSRDACQSVDDQLGWTMKLIRACEKGHANTISKCMVAYPALIDIFGAKKNLDDLRNHAVFLNRSSILHERPIK